ncbi:hypothetical protein J9317_19590 [Metabacillus sp. KIGAM252]|uniref:Uncharacterized protein n=1 Tax=Metabacillus flavus TaxID=2823519 RepID=A0ABS5LJX1_9BACI|nr:hypothetical protein [Metabacillus flavus]MBS2970949.1 hypothetical protein [Metabacillus flavus]
MKKECDARQECQAKWEERAMPGKNARQDEKGVRCQARMPGKMGRTCNAREECQAR